MNWYVVTAKSLIGHVPSGVGAAFVGATLGAVLGVTLGLIDGTLLG